MRPLGSPRTKTPVSQLRSKNTGFAKPTETRSGRSARRSGVAIAPGRSQAPPRTPDRPPENPVRRVFAGGVRSIETNESVARSTTRSRAGWGLAERRVRPLGSPRTKTPGSPLRPDNTGFAKPTATRSGRSARRSGVAIAPGRSQAPPRASGNTFEGLYNTTGRPEGRPTGIQAGRGTAQSWPSSWTSSVSTPPDALGCTNAIRVLWAPDRGFWSTMRTPEASNRSTSAPVSSTWYAM